MVWDDDHYYMGGVIAELLADHGCETHYLTPASEASTWTQNTMEQHFIQARLLENGVTIRSFTALDAVSEGSITASCVFTGRTEEIEADAVVLVTSRAPEDRLARELAARADDWKDAGIETVTSVGGRAGAGDHRPRGLCRPPLRGGIGRPGGGGRRRSLQARDRRIASPRLIETPYDSRRAAIRNSALPSRPLIGLSTKTQHRPTLGREPVADGFADFRVNRRVADDAALADALPPRLELRLDQGDEARAGSGERKRRRQDRAQADEARVADDEVDGLRHVFAREITRVGSLQHRDAGIVAQTSVKLTVADIDRIDPPRPALTQHVGEASGGGTDIQRGEPARVDAGNA